MRLIESDAFPFEFLSRLAERESWRKEIHRPIYHVHKWWAKRLGSVFRGILLGSLLPEDADLASQFYRQHDFAQTTVFDPFMGSGTTVGEAHKLGLAALGRDINPVAVESVRTALGPMDRKRIKAAFQELSESVGTRIRALYRCRDSQGRACDALYYFWVMQAACPECRTVLNLFSSSVLARNAYPNRKRVVQIRCPSCGSIFPGVHGQGTATCPLCHCQFGPDAGPATGAKAGCVRCGSEFKILDALGRTGSRPAFRLYAKLVLRQDKAKEYLPATAEDQAAYEECSARLKEELHAGRIVLPGLKLAQGYNTRQAINYGFTSWRDFFGDRQLLALGWLHRAICDLRHEPTRQALFTLFSGVLEFNNLFASYKGEGTGAVRHMFSHHILKPERTPIEANVWGTTKSSGSFSNLFRSRLLRAIDYRLAPTEIGAANPGSARVCALPLSGRVERKWPCDGEFVPRGIYLSCGDSAQTGLPDGSIDMVVTDPPFFDNVHYSELADFFFAWQQLRTAPRASATVSTRDRCEVQDSDAQRFAAKLLGVFGECRRVLKDDGLLVFTYHHSREEGWRALAQAVLGAGFAVVNSQPVKAEMSVATPKSQAKEPIQLDVIIVCRKQDSPALPDAVSPARAIESAKSKLARLRSAGFRLSRSDRRVVLFGQLLATLRRPGDEADLAQHVGTELDADDVARPTPSKRQQQQLLFDTG